MNGAFEAFAGTLRWIAWRNEERGGKLTKVPYGARGRRAKSNNCETWITREEAESRSRNLVNGQGGGIGIQLGDLGDGRWLAGVDLDTCIDADGCLAPWAEKILGELPTYAETSPSGTGIKAFFIIDAAHVRPFLDLIRATPEGWGIKRGIDGNDRRDHAPGVEIYLSHRFFAVTEQLYPGGPDFIRTLDWDELQRLAKALPQKQPRPGKGKGQDTSRSAAAFRLGAKMRREGKSFEEFVEAALANAETAEWTQTKGLANDSRELIRIWEKVDPGKRRDPDTGAPQIIVEGGNRHVAAELGIAALVAADVPFYQRNRTIQRLTSVKAKNTSGEVMMVPGIVSVEKAMMGRALGRSAVWVKFDMRRMEYVRIDPPDKVAEQILGMVGEWPFDPLTGIVQCPTLRRDGSLLDQPGYDERTGLILVNGVKMPEIPKKPTKDIAAAALKFLCDLLAEFPFVDEESKAVALSMLITPVVRGAMSVAPMHLATAPLPGTGKSYLADCASMIAMGERCAVESAAPKYEETEKRLIGSALAAFPIIALDNCREFIGGDFFCQIVERPLMSLRALGKSDKFRIPNTFTMFANGNNVSVAEDMIRRTIRSGLDANMEHPEKRSFEANPLASIQQRRGEYIAAALTIPLAYLSASGPNGLPPPLISFEDWCRIVREPLIWLEYADPVKTQEKLRVADPRKLDVAALFDVWKEILKIGKLHARRTSEIIEEATKSLPLLAALFTIAPARFGESKIDPKALGTWLSAHEGVIASSCKLCVDRTDAARPKWYLDWHKHP